MFRQQASKKKRGKIITIIIQSRCYTRPVLNVKYRGTVTCDINRVQRHVVAGVRRVSGHSLYKTYLGQ